MLQENITIFKKIKVIKLKKNVVIELYEKNIKKKKKILTMK